MRSWVMRKNFFYGKVKEHFIVRFLIFPEWSLVQQWVPCSVIWSNLSFLPNCNLRMIRANREFRHHLLFCISQRFWIKKASFLAVTTCSWNPKLCSIRSATVCQNDFDLSGKLLENVMKKVRLDFFKVQWSSCSCGHLEFLENKLD